MSTCIRNTKQCIHMSTCMHNAKQCIHMSTCMHNTKQCIHMSTCMHNTKQCIHMIGRRGGVEYPPRSLDLTPLDFFLWGHIKNNVYARRPQNIDQLGEIIEETCHGIDDDTILDVCRSVGSRCQHCIDVDAGHFQHLRYWLN